MTKGRLPIRRRRVLAALSLCLATAWAWQAANQRAVAQPPESYYSRGASDFSSRHATPYTRLDDGRFRDWRDHRRGGYPQPLRSQWIQRPYPYHLDYYRMRYGGSYAPYFGNLYGPPAYILPPGYYGGVYYY